MLFIYYCEEQFRNVCVNVVVCINTFDELKGTFPDSSMIFFCFRFPVVFLTDQGPPSVMQHVVSVVPSSLLLHSI